MPEKSNRRAPHKKIAFIIGGFVLLLLGILLFDIVKYSPVIFQLLFNKEIELKKANTHMNVLLMGVGGGQHEGPQLTDTVMFASIDEGKNIVSMVSIPRDLYIPELKGKINTAYAIGEGKHDGGGITLSRAVVSKIMNKPIDYVVVVDFNGFVKAVDEVGGLDVTVDRAFDDYEYPIEENREELCGHTLEEATQLIATQTPTEVFPCRYQHVHFDKGLQHMDGKQALVFVRSRYAKGSEGTDFARSRRQQKIIQAFKDKVFSLGIILNPLKITALYSLLSNSIHTDVKQEEFDDFIKLAQKMKNGKIQSIVLETEDTETNKKGLLINPPLEEFNGTWVLIPKAGSGSYLQIQKYVSCIQNSTSPCAIQ